jgi:3-hydroxyacyl-CoA dehydrogenase/enoyl-CoA hydratase/3-hydroxybutyryl-CoA epimerase
VTQIELEQRGEVAVAWLDRPEGGPNLLDEGLLSALPGLLERLESDRAIEAVVLASRKPEGFVAGADIALFDRLADKEEAFALVRDAQRLIERLARLPKPTVAAIHGVCAGGGLELAMACDTRIGSADGRTRLSLPEVQLGLLPALGGTQRLPRLVGLRAGLELLLSGRNVYARPAKRLGLVGALVHSEGLVQAAVQAAKESIGRAPGRIRARSRRTEWLVENSPARELIFNRAEAVTRRRTLGNYPAPARILQTVRRTFGGDLEEGLRTEAEAFSELLFTDASRSLRHLFFVRRAARKNRTGAQPLEVREVAVLGAGLMGGGIAQVSTHPAGYRVLLRDQTLELAARGKGAVHRGLEERVGKGLSAFERDAAVQRVQASDGLAGFERVDLTIEAVPEVLELKRKVLQEVEAVTRPEHVFASNTSSLPIGLIASGASRPDRVVGMHYFSPVPRMPLLEVVRGPHSSPEALATAVETGLEQGKAVIVVEDGPGFYVNRILAPYLNEALLLVREGAAIDEVDRAMEQGGFPVGPFRLLDNVGLDVAAKATEVLDPLFAARGVNLEQASARLLAAGLSGRKVGKGFYLYRRDGKRIVNEEAYRLLGAGKRNGAEWTEIHERLLLALVNEAVRCLHDGIIDSPDSGDAGAVFGIGFPPFLGGPFHYVRAVGRERLAERLQALEQRHGKRFQAAPGL